MKFLNTIQHATTTNNVTEEQVSHVVGTSVTLFSFIASSYRAAEVIVVATQGSTYQIQKLLIIHDGTNVNITEYGMAEIGVGFTTKPSYTATLATGTITVYASSSPTSTTYKVTYKLFSAT